MNERQEILLRLRLAEWNRYRQSTGNLLLVLTIITLLLLATFLYSPSKPFAAILFGGLSAILLAAARLLYRAAEAARISNLLQTTRQAHIQDSTVIKVEVVTDF